MNNHDKKWIEIEGLKDEGPGDIVGAIASKTDVPGHALGEIELEDHRATVEVSAEDLDEVVKTMNGNRIGSSRVEVSYLSDNGTNETSDIDGYASKWRDLVELEREEEMREHEREIKQMSGREREAEGRAILHLRGRDEGEGLSGYLVKFMRNHKGEELPENEISVGDLVMISKKDPLRDDNPTGTVTEQTNYSITVSFSEKPHGFVFGRDLRMDLYVNDITYQRMLDAIDQFASGDAHRSELREILAGWENPSGTWTEEIYHWYNSNLNESQKEAVRQSLGTNDFFLIHGPPGTGKTTTAIEVIQQQIERGRTVLATADSNMAVDNMVEFLIDQGLFAVRAGHPARVTPALKQHTLDALVQDNETYQKSQDLREKAFEIKDRQEDLTHPSGRWRRGMSNEKIRSLAKDGRGSRGVSAEKIDEMAEWLKLQEKADEYFEKSDELEEKAIENILDRADVVCTTNSTAGSDLLENRTFDVLVLDEATQATEPSCLIPMTKAEQVIMAGDHRQLPPTVKNREAAQNGMRETLFEKLAERHGDSIKQMLTVQYRMHRDIMTFSSQAFYDSELKADDTVRDHTLADLNLRLTSLNDLQKRVLDPEEPLVFVNTRYLDAEERSRAGSTSKENRTEAKIVTTLAEQLVSAGLDPEQLAIIAPYDDQVDLIDQNIDHENLEVKTVDGFQGREKEVVLISMTRSNVPGTIGFLDEHRRFNVALTRAKRKAVVVGDESTIATDDLYKSFIGYTQDRGRTIELEEQNKDQLVEQS